MKPKKFKPKNKRTKKILIFNDEERKEYLTGFKKRKDERRKRAKEDIESKMKSERRRLKQQQKEAFHSMRAAERGVPGPLSCSLDLENFQAGWSLSHQAQIKHASLLVDVQHRLQQQMAGVMLSEEVEHLLEPITTHDLPDHIVTITDSIDLGTACLDTKLGSNKPCQDKPMSSSVPACEPTENTGTSLSSKAKMWKKDNLKRSKNSKVFKKKKSMQQNKDKKQGRKKFNKTKKFKKKHGKRKNK